MIDTSEPKPTTRDCAIYESRNRTGGVVKLQSILCEHQLCFDYVYNVCFCSISVVRRLAVLALFLKMPRFLRFCMAIPTYPSEDVLRTHACSARVLLLGQVAGFRGDVIGF